MLNLNRIMAASISIFLMLVGCSQSSTIAPIVILPGPSPTAIATPVVIPPSPSPTATATKTGRSTYYVSTTGSGTTCSSSSPCSLSSGLGKLISGDTLYLKSGTYLGAVSLAKSNITLATAPGEPSQAIISGDLNRNGTADTGDVNPILLEIRGNSVYKELHVYGQGLHSPREAPRSESQALRAMA